jgi:hypothetical protein
LPAGANATRTAINAVPVVGKDLNWALTTTPRGLISPATGGEISSIGQRLGSGGISKIGAIAGPALAIASIVLGFEEDGLIGGLANLLSTVAYFDPEPISRVILTVVGAVFGQIFAHHKQRVAIESAVECASTPAVSEAVATIEAAVMDGRIFPEHGSQLLDHLYNDLFGRLTSAPCPAPPIVKINPNPPILVNPHIITMNESSFDSAPARATVASRISYYGGAATRLR